MDSHDKTPSDQVREISKLVSDSVEKLEQVLFALRQLQERLTDQSGSNPGHD